MAPEILSYEKYDATADLWSVGAVLYEMSVGRPPFRANNHIELLNKINRANSRVPFPDEDPAKAATATPVPVDIKQLIRMLLKRNPVERAGYDDFFKAPALAGLSSPFFTHAHGLSALASTSNPPPPGTRTAIPTSTRAESSRSTSKPPTATAPATSNLNSSPTQEMHVGPDGQPYDPRLYTMQDTFHVRRKKHRDKDNDRSRGDRNGDGASNGGSADIDSLTPGQETRRSSNQYVLLCVPKVLIAHTLSDSRGKSSPLLRSVDVEGVLKQDYVVVDDTRAIEFNRVADG